MDFILNWFCVGFFVATSELFPWRFSTVFNFLRSSFLSLISFLCLGSTRELLVLDFFLLFFIKLKLKSTKVIVSVNSSTKLSVFLNSESFILNTLSSRNLEYRSQSIFFKFHISRLGMLSLFRRTSCMTLGKRSLLVMLFENDQSSFCERDAFANGRCWKRFG